MIAFAKELEPGSLVRHVERPGVWRVLGIAGMRAEIEPWDDQAAGSFHPSEAYVISARVRLLDRLQPGGPHAYAGHQGLFDVPSEVVDQLRCGCCDRGGQYNGFDSGPPVFSCPKHCSCHD